MNAGKTPWRVAWDLLGPVSGLCSQDVPRKAVEVARLGSFPCHHRGSTPECDGQCKASANSMRPLIGGHCAFPLRYTRRHPPWCPSNTDRTTPATGTAKPKLDLRYKQNAPDKPEESLHLRSTVRLPSRATPGTQQRDAAKQSEVTSTSLAIKGAVRFRRPYHHDSVRRDLIGFRRPELACGAHKRHVTLQLVSWQPFQSCLVVRQPATKKLH